MSTRSGETLAAMVLVLLGAPEPPEAPDPPDPLPLLLPKGLAPKSGPLDPLPPAPPLMDAGFDRQTL